MPRNRHPHRKRPPMGSNGHKSSPPATIPENPGRSILASVGIRPDRIGQPGFCMLCGRGVEDGAIFTAPVYAHVCAVPDASGAQQPCEACDHDARERARTDLVCTFCSFRQSTTQFSGPIFSGIRKNRMRVFSESWRCVMNTNDGAAWVHDLRKFRVIESIALSHDAEPDKQPRASIAGLPVRERTEFGDVAVVRTFDGLQDIHREKFTALDSETIARAVWKWNSERGWRWWHHVSVAREDRAMPSYDDLATIRREFVTTGRECYQIFPPEDRFVNIHERCLHLWHCVDGMAADAGTGRILPQFESEVSGQQQRTVKLI